MTFEQEFNAKALENPDDAIALMSREVEKACKADPDMDKRGAYDRILAGFEGIPRLREYLKNNTPSTYEEPECPRNVMLAHVKSNLAFAHG
ncbi:MAG: hypothetical protein DI551_12575 [Micavibrio aeruginosavorus]|uniref:Uncharacterized protein n=1 Tax=Micavibrio aeruginosavorus TaxID=349221 RepID=A0A2W5PVU4_9BACT|nr:MAG: hypothetical protein DI551_12575 [Micavibrio aeruginosavorus]